MYAQLLTFGAAFLGSAVESVEALTIVLAVGLTRGWRAPLYGTVAALVLLALLVAFFGQLIVTRVPEVTLKLVIGTLLVLFGLRWLHKAVLRSAGVVAMHALPLFFRSKSPRITTSNSWISFFVGNSVMALLSCFAQLSSASRSRSARRWRGRSTS